MSQLPTPAEQILEDSTGPVSATGDTGSATAHSIPNRIAAAKFAGAEAAKCSPMGGVRRSRLRPGHTTGLDVGRYSDMR